MVFGRLSGSCGRLTELWPNREAGRDEPSAREVDEEERDRKLPGLKSKSGHLRALEALEQPQEY